MLNIIYSLVSLALLVPFIIALIHVSISYFLAWIDLRLENMKQHFHPNRQHIPKLKNYLKSFVIEIFCRTATIILYPMSLISDKSKTNNGKPILLVHGYNLHKAAWLWFKYKLEEKGVGPIYTINLSPPYASIERIAENLAETIDQIRNENNDQKISLIGHSMGGLVCSYCSEYLLMEKECVSEIITLGSPLNGTRLAALGHGENIIQMTTQSPFLEKLRVQIESSTIPYYHIASKLDNIIVPWQSALPNEVKKDHCLILENSGHLQMFISSHVIEKVFEWISPT